jgi:hypothetical protein
MVNAAQHSGFFMKWDFVHGETSFKKGGAVRGFWADEHKFALCSHYGGMGLYRAADWQEVDTGPCFKTRSGASALHFDHSSLVAGAGHDTMMGQGQGIHLWSLR